jgi:hypothetical protein
MLTYIRNYVYTSKVALSIKKMQQCEKILVAGMGKCEFFEEGSGKVFNQVFLGL